MNACYDKRKARASPFTIRGLEAIRRSWFTPAVLSAAELLALLRERGVTNAEIARLLDLPSSRVSEMFAGKRRLQLDEAKRLVDHFQIEEPAPHQISPLNVSVARLLVLHGASALGLRVSPDDPRVEELARDFRAFSMFANDPRVRESAEAVEGFFQGLRLAQDRTASA